MTLALRQVRFTPMRMDGVGPPTIARGYYNIEPTSPYDDGTGRVERIPLMVNIDGASVIKDIPVTPTDFSWAWKVTGHLVGQADDTVEYIAVPAGTYATVLDYENLTRLDPNTLGPVSVVTSAIELRIEALEAIPPGSAAGVSSFHGRTGAVTATTADIGDATATGISLMTAANAAAAAGVVGAVTTTGAQSVAGVKTFTDSPIVPDPTTAQQAASKAYVDAGGGGGAVVDATTSVKGKIQLAGDLAGTAALPTVPGLTTKANDSAVVHNSGNETLTGIKTFSNSPIIPDPTTAQQAGSKAYIDAAVATIITSLTAGYGIRVTKYINYSTGVWPARATALPAGYADIVIWYSLGYSGTAATPSGAIDGDLWERDFPP